MVTQNITGEGYQKEETQKDGNALSLLTLRIGTSGRT